MKRVASIVVLLLPFGAGASAEMAIVHGKVTDSAGMPVGGYPVILENQVSAAQGWTSNIGFTSADGAFAVAVDQAGSYVAKLPNAPEISASFEVTEDMFQSSTGLILPDMAEVDGATMPTAGYDIGTITLPAQ